MCAVTNSFTDGTTAVAAEVNQNFTDSLDVSKHTIASETQGDVLYYNGSAWARLGVGTTGQTLITQGASANPAWAFTARKVTSTTRNLATASGNQTITGAGFTPTGVIIFANVDGDARASWAFVSSDLIGKGLNDLNGDTAASYGAITTDIDLRTVSGTQQTAVVTSFNSDGCVLAWTKTGSPTGTANLNFFFLR